MPTYQTTFRANGLMTIRNRFGKTLGEVIDRTLDEENKGDWVGDIEFIELVKVED
jgi:hypothetical protein